MFTRRQLLLTTTALSAAPLRSLFAAPANLAATVQAAAGTAAGAPAKSLAEAFDRIVDRRLTLSPESATSFGLDIGAHAAARRLLDDRSLAGRAANRRNNAAELKDILAFKREKLSHADAVNYDTVIYALQVQTFADKHFPAMDSPGAPYVIYQLGGAYRNVPDFLDRQHKIESRSDAEAYLARLQALAKAVDQEIETASHDVAAGVRPPTFALEKTRTQLKALRDQTAAESQLVQSVVRRTAEQNIPGDWNARATEIYTRQIQPALDREMAWVDATRAKASSDAGVWTLPNGDAYYETALKHWTTSTMPADEIHQTGLALVAELSNEIDKNLRAQGLKDGTVGQRLAALSRDSRFLLPNTDESRTKVLADLNGLVEKVNALLPKYFGTLPKSKVEIRRVPPTIEAGQSLGYYIWPAMDGSRPGAYYLNLRDMKELPSWKLPSVTYHETMPGHHLQLSLQTEASLPMIRRMSFYSAYIEGWALYAEQLADEMGLYQGDPFARVGYLSEQLHRAVRLVLDTGLHRKRWTREKAVQYSVDVIGDPQSAAITEVERYAVWPGQACAYMLGKLVWLRVRNAAQQRLGAQFDLRKFHDAGLLSGAVPLTVLEQNMAELKGT
jgi:uncharacterized protein (DUF885 family)